MSDPNRDPMAKSDPFLNPGDFQEDMGMFEAATHAPTVALADVDLKTVLFTPDRSNQDPTGRALARLLAETVGANFIEAPDLKTNQDLIAAHGQHPTNLLVLPVPFGRDIAELGEASLGDVVDRLLGTDLPILAIRQPLAESALPGLLNNVVVPLSPDNPRNDRALAWACRILGRSGTLTVVEVADASLRAEADMHRSPAEPVQQTATERINRVLSRFFAGSVGAIQRKAADRGFQIQVITAGGRFVDSTLMQVKVSPGLVIVPGSLHRQSNPYHNEADLILSSQYPVLVV